jgi:4-alpha-glucanotransferase
MSLVFVNPAGRGAVVKRSHESKLRKLARLHSIQNQFVDVLGRRRTASGAVLCAILAARGVDVSDRSVIDDLIRARNEAIWNPPIEPVSVVWLTSDPAIHLRLAIPSPSTIRLRAGGVDTTRPLADLRAGGVIQTPLGARALFDFPLPVAMCQPGYYDVELEAGGNQWWSSRLLVAPQCAWPGQNRGPRHGIFAPLHAVRSARSSGAGDFTDGERLVEWAATGGASYAGMLPLLATFFDELFDPSPYAPVSRLFWNELYLDVTALPEVRSSEKARSLLSRSETRDEIGRLRETKLVEYRAEMRWKREILEASAEHFFSAPATERRERFERFAGGKHLLDEYAQFRAATEQDGKPWMEWPEGARRGRLSAESLDPARIRYHRFVQWLADEQLGALATRARERGAGLYLDFPLGSNSAGFDVWQHQHLYVTGASIGAPPDLAYEDGQDWGFRPLEPDALRQDGYRHWIACIRHQLEKSAMLRLDHVMGLHRLLWIPEGFTPAEGAYVRYRAEEHYAILSIESHRAGAEIVGEDLGTVPQEVRAMMLEHGVKRMFILQRQLAHGGDDPPGEVPGNAVVGLNTHDMPPFAAFWQGLDIDERARFGVVKQQDVEAQKERRQAIRTLWTQKLIEAGLLEAGVDDLATITEASLRWLAQSPAEVLLINVEDLWLETESQNIPTTTTAQRPNWQPKLAMTLEQMFDDEFPVPPPESRH